MTPAFRPHALACALFVATVAVAQEVPPVPALPPNPLAPVVVTAPPPSPGVTLGPVLSPDGLLVSETSLEPPRPKWEMLPNSLLWEPKLADRREPRLTILRSDVDSYFSNKTQDPSIGLTTGLFRLRPDNFPWIEWQVDIFAVAHLRFSRGDESIAQDYRYGLPITWRAGNWQGKIGYEHTSTQLGDEFNFFLGRQRVKFERDEAVGAIGYLWDNQFRTYVQVGYAVYQSIPGISDPFRYDVGFDWFKRESTGPRGQPFAAVNAAFNPEVDYAVSMSYQVGWMWRKNDTRLGQIRLYAQYYDGYSTFGQLFRDRERFVGLGFSLDY